MDSVLIRPRYSLGVRLVMAALLLGSATFFAFMAVLVSHDSALECQSPAVCLHVERYPFGIVNQDPVAPIRSAQARWQPGGRVAALALVLSHVDGTRTEYPGVGKNGDRAEDAAEAINAYLAGGASPSAFALREGSLPASAFIGLLAAASLALLTHFFSKLRIVSSAQSFDVTVERWPAPPRRRVLRRAEAPRIVVRERVVNAQPFFILWLEAASGAPFELGLAFRSQARASDAQASFTQLLG